MRILFFIAFIFTFQSTFSQDEINYNRPPSFRSDNVEINCDNIISNESYCKFKLVVDNTSENEFLILHPNKVAFIYAGIGTYYPRKGKEIIIEPSNKTTKVIKIDGAMDYRISSFQIDVDDFLHGTKKESLPFEGLKIAIGGSATDIELDNVTLKCEKPISKKGKVTLNLFVTNNIDNSLLHIVTNNVVIKDGSGNPLKYEIGRSKTININSGDEQRLKIVFVSQDSSFEIGTTDVFYPIKLSPLDITPFLISDGSTKTVATQTHQEVAVTESPSCGAFTGGNSGSVEVLFANETISCFKLEVDGFPAVTEFSKVAKLYLNPGKHTYKITLDNGHVFEESKYMSDTYSAIGYKIKAKKKDKYVISYMAGKQVLNEKGQEQRTTMMENTSQAGGNNDSSSAGEGCYGEPSSGVTSVKLLVTWKGSPISNNDIQIKQNNVVIGNNRTGSDGKVNIKTGSLDHNKIDVFGCNGNNKWSVTGDWVVLDGNRYFHLKLDEVAKMMSEFLGGSVDQIGAGWGF